MRAADPGELALDDLAGRRHGHLVDDLHPLGPAHLGHVVRNGAMPDGPSHRAPPRLYFAAPLTTQICGTWMSAMGTRPSHHESNFCRNGHKSIKFNISTRYIR